MAAVPDLYIHWTEPLRVRVLQTPLALRKSNYLVLASRRNRTLILVFPESCIRATGYAHSNLTKRKTTEATFSSGSLGIGLSRT
ncbi:hypothetical protein RRG08_020435 [Elysia crispata]|uniref:Uncharacterized protein n=1 Tax=Elysia crispata TaxID=231223 RepID=A0AAE1B4Y0_9GAST|nr:hypothetical protein RRG08_020435 [Elysia crispata]